MRKGQKGPHWSASELKILRELSDSEAATRLKRSLNSIKRKRQRLGIPRPNKLWITDARRELLGTMKDQDLAAELGLSVLTIKKWRRKLKIPVFKLPKVPKPRKPRKATIVRAERGGWPEKSVQFLRQLDAGAIAEHTGVQVEDVIKKRSRLKTGE